MTDKKQEIVELIKSLNIVPQGSKPLSPGVPLREQGIDSLDMMTLFLNVEEKFKIKIPDSEIDALVSIEKIAAYVDQHSQ